MHPLLAKAIARGLTLPNVLSYLSQKTLGLWRYPSTLALYTKAKLLGVTIGTGVVAHGSVGLFRWPGGSITIGNNVHCISSWRRATAATIAAPVRLRVFGNGAIIIGDGCELTGTSITARSTSITLGKNVLLAPDCVIVDSDFHAPWPSQQRSVDPGVSFDKPVTIDDYAWIGMRSIILKGVHIGTGALIGAGSVVTHDIPPNTLACGVPARVIAQNPK
ncbi:MAG: acyltransferase [Desulfovibrio sp.]|nr:acyltransferase [Desulfovibrio sp.]